MRDLNKFIESNNQNLQSKSEAKDQKYHITTKMVLCIFEQSIISLPFKYSYRHKVS